MGGGRVSQVVGVTNKHLMKREVREEKKNRKEKHWVELIRMEV